VLSAVEGLEVAAPGLEPYVLPIAATILVVLFAIQQTGTAVIGRAFGPVMVLWFVVLGVLGVESVMDHPDILRSLHPGHAFRFFTDHGFRGFLVLGSVVLVVTGAEALYADMGHFGRRPIRLAWFGLVLPSLLLNYMGQGALVLGNPTAAENPFFLLAPTALRIPLIVLATMAAIIASQALISGAFSLAMQSSLLGYFPRLRVEHTSRIARGQVYVPAINWSLMVACLALVFGFRSSSSLAAAYGLAVTATMAITTVLFAAVARERWKWPRPVVVAITAVFLTIDLAFLGANLFKIPAGGWFPLAMAALLFTLMTTWKTGKRLVGERLREGDIPLRAFVDSLEPRPPHRVRGTAVYLYRRPFSAPPILITNLRLHGVLHEQVILLSVEVEDIPRVHPRRALEVHHLGRGITQAILHVGYQQQPDVPRALEADATELRYHPLDSFYFLGRDTILVTGRPGMARWRERLFAVMSRNTRNAASYFGIPANRAVEVGLQVEL
jgi:KUP system potassium uptake protein